MGNNVFYDFGVFLIIFRICFLSFRKLSKIVQERYDKSKYQKKSPEMNVSERDLFPVKILSKSDEKQKSYHNLQLHEKKSTIFF